jgi:hypothetical protein
VCHSATRIIIQIALEGDKVRTSDQGVVPIPQGFCWIEGDNQDNSVDSGA